MNDMIHRLIEQVLGRASGPLHLRLVLQPTIAAILAIRAGRRDSHDGTPPFLWEIFTNPAERAKLIQSGWKDIAKVFVIAIILDTVYQLVVFRSYYPLQAILMAGILAIVPYCLLRGPASRLFRQKRSAS